MDRTHHESTYGDVIPLETAGPISVTAGVSQDEAGFVTLVWGNRQVVMSPAEALQLALNVGLAAEAAQIEASVFRVMKRMLDEDILTNHGKLSSTALAAAFLAEIRAERLKESA